MSKMTINELQAELDSIIDWFESDEVDIDQAEEKYRRGLELAEALKQQLAEAKNNISKLKQSFSSSTK